MSRRQLTEEEREAFRTAIACILWEYNEPCYALCDRVRNLSELARAAGVTRGAVMGWLKHPTPYSIARCAATLGVEESELKPIDPVILADGEKKSIDNPLG